MTLFKCLMLGLVLIIPVAVASEPDNVVAVGLLEEGFVHCTNATQFSRTDQAVAQKQYEMYIATLARAIAISPKVLTENGKLSRQVQQCARVGDDIARLRALPLLEQGLLACKSAKKLAKGDYLSKARIKYKEYRELKNRAIALSNTVQKVGSNSSKIRRCDKFEQGLVAAQTRIDKQEQQALALISLLQRSTDSCRVAQRMAIQSGQSRAKLGATQSMLAYAEEYFQDSLLHTDATDRAIRFPGYSTSKNIKEMTTHYTICKEELVAVISAATQSVVRQEELAEIRIQTRIDQAVALAVSKVMGERVDQQNVAVISENEVSVDSVAIVDVISTVSDATVDKLPVTINRGAEENPVEVTYTNKRLGKRSNGRRVTSDVVQVTKSW